MKRILMLIAVVLLMTSAEANAQNNGGQVGGNINIYPAGTTAFYLGANGQPSNYFYMPPVVYNNYGPSTYSRFSYYNRGQGYYVPPNGNGGGGYYSNTPGYYGNYYGR